MKDIKLKATFSDSENVIEFSISDLVRKMGGQGAGDWSLEEEVGKDFAYLSDNFENVILEVVD